MSKHRILSGLAIASLGLVGAIGALRIESRDATTGGPSEDFALVSAASEAESHVSAVECYPPETGTEPTPRHTRDSNAGSDSVSGDVGLGRFLRGSLDMICLSDRHLEGGPFATPEVYRSSGHLTVEKLACSNPSVTRRKRGRSASAIEAASK